MKTTSSSTLATHSHPSISCEESAPTLVPQVPCSRMVYGKRLSDKLQILIHPKLFHSGPKYFVWMLKDAEVLK